MFHKLNQIDRWDTDFTLLSLLQIKSPTHCPFNKRRLWTFKFITICNHHNPSDCCKTLNTVSFYLMTFIHQYHYYIMHILHSNYQYENTLSLYLFWYLTKYLYEMWELIKDILQISELTTWPAFYSSMALEMNRAIQFQLHTGPLGR